MSIDTKSVIMKAWHEHYALLTVDCMNLESAHTAIRVMEKSRTPIILNLYQGHLAHFPVPVATAVIGTLAESASVPVAPALGHGKNPNCIHQASRVGFSGLMIDTSAFPLEENMRQTRAVVELTASARLCVEGELGYLVNAPHYDQAANADLIARPADVEPLIAQTGIDLLAASVSTTYGMYAPGVVPAINFQCLAEVSRYSSVPLALHGGNGTSLGQLRLYTILGVAKINVGTAIFERGKSAFLHTLCHDISIELVDALKAMELALGEAIASCLQVSGSIGKI